jgi:hypothetical protein
MRGIRDAIAFGTFEKFRQSLHRTFSRRPRYNSGRPEHPLEGRSLIP